MDSTLNYILKFTSNADKVTAGINKLDEGVNKVNTHVGTLGNNFSKAMDKINSKLSTIRLSSFIQNVQSVATGLDSLNAPGLKLSSSLADLSAITDVTGEKLKEIEGYARQSAKTFGVDAADSVESYKLILSQLTPELAKAPKALQAMGESVNILSKTMGGNTAAATEVLTTAMNQYQVSTADPIKASAEMARMMNIMAAAAKEGSAELPQIKAGLEQAGLAGKTANVSFAETNAHLQVLDKAGKKGSEGGVALRNVMASLAQGRFLPKDVQKELQAAGVDINILGDRSLTLSDRLKPLRGIMNDQALVTKMFGKENSNAAIAMISGIDEAERLTVAIQGTNTAYEQAAIVMDSQAEKNKRLTKRVDDFKISLFNATGGVMGYASVLGGMAFDISNLLPLFGGFGKVIGFVTRATKLQALWMDIMKVKTFLWAEAQMVLDAAMMPMFLIPAIIMAVGFAIVWVIENVEGLGKAWQHTINGGKLLFQLFGESVKLQFTTVVNVLLIALDKIKKGYYEFKEAVGIGDSSENQAMIAKIDAQTEARKKAIVDQAKKVGDTASKAKDEFAKAVGSVSIKTDVALNPNFGGITDPTIPGVGTGGTGTEGAGAGSCAGTKTNTAIATGGTKHTYVTINLKELIGVLNIKANDFKDSSKQMQDQATDALLRTLAMATTAGN